MTKKLRQNASNAARVLNRFCTRTQPLLARFQSCARWQECCLTVAKQLLPLAEGDATLAMVPASSLHYPFGRSLRRRSGVGGRRAGTRLLGLKRVQRVACIAAGEVSQEALARSEKLNIDEVRRQCQLPPTIRSLSHGHRMRSAAQCTKNGLVKRPAL